MNILYRTRATATGGRTGKASTTDGAFSVALVTLREPGGPGGGTDITRELVDRAHVVCPYSHLTRNGLDVRLSLAA